MLIFACFPDVTSNYVLNVIVSDRELRSENVTCDDEFNGEYEKRIKNVKCDCDVNVK